MSPEQRDRYGRLIQATNAQSAPSTHNDAAGTHQELRKAWIRPFHRDFIGRR
jgi:hypothetical protein